MECKGSVLSSVPNFVRKRFGDEGLQRWRERLGPEAQAVYSKPIMPSIWYPLIPCLAEPTVALCDLFYGGDMKGAWESGRYTAEEALGGIYKIFVIVGRPENILKKGATAMSMLYRPSEMALTEFRENRGTLTITHFPEPHRALDARLGGFIEQSLLICGCKGLTVVPGRLMTNGDPVSEYLVKWG